ncbi:hypothetical protein M407DRAFT_22362 [Tulasnella calospora MUT 4182]|uniref:Uncharacterized protein n=1 Tax=Tulasnella calospora MUT 4182 TaxID=1051891 RepID=A0A0C3QN78_9AGAM|nr:hypothetical protein M407DRAFT_22362 [Tulasnella calospora MUT 4182]
MQATVLQEGPVVPVLSTFERGDGNSKQGLWEPKCSPCQKSSEPSWITQLPQL